MTTQSNSDEDLLIEDIVGFTHDPLGYVHYAYDWGNGELVDSAGPREWQEDIFREIGDHLQNPETRFQPLRIAIASGHGIGKSANIGMIIKWAMDTCEDCKIVCTANTEKQLNTKTAPEAAKWARNAISSHWTASTATAIASKDKEHERNWRCDFVAWSEHNTEAFAGLHNLGKRIVLIFDEASAIADKVWEVAEGALTDKNTEIIWIAYGNPTRNSGRFKECFERLRHRWIHRKIDSRTVDGTNLEEIQKWVDDYGEDSDFVRVRVRGEFPRAGVTQFISSDVVEAARERDLELNELAPVIIGVDVARFGDDMSVILIRQGRKVLDIRKHRGLRGPELGRFTVEARNEFKAKAIFVDGGGLGAGVCDYLHDNGYEHTEVQFGAAAHKSGDNGYFNKRAEMWGDMRDWLETGDIPKDEDLATDLTSPEYTYDAKMRIILEKKEDMKKRGLASPDVADALAVTFAEPVRMLDPEEEQQEWRRKLTQSRKRNWLTA